MLMMVTDLLFLLFMPESAKRSERLPRLRGLVGPDRVNRFVQFDLYEAYKGHPTSTVDDPSSEVRDYGSRHRPVLSSHCQ